MKKVNNYLPSVRNDYALQITNIENIKNNHEFRHEFELDQRCEPVRSVNVTSDNRYLIITSENRNARIRVLDLEKLEFLPHKYSGHTASVRLTSITRDNTAFHTASWDGSSRKYEIASGRCSRQIIGGYGRSPSCFVDPEGKYLFTASYDSDIDPSAKNTGRCWDLSSYKVINLYKHKGERGPLECIDIAYDQKYVYTGSDDGCAFSFDLKGDGPRLKYFKFDGTVRKLAITDKYFAAACSDGLVRIHDKISGEKIRYLRHCVEDEVMEVRISKDQTRLFSASTDGSVKCFNLFTGQALYHRNIHEKWIWSICLMNNDKVLVTGSRDGFVSILAADSGQVLAQLPNLSTDTDSLIICPPDKIFPNGFFYTTTEDYVKVYSKDNESDTWKELDLSDLNRTLYINKLNLKNLIITRLKNNGNYNSLVEHFLRNQKLLSEIGDRNPPRILKA